jgi:hypothetical protein
MDLLVAAAERARDMNFELLASIDMLREAQAGEAAAAAASAAANAKAADAAGTAARAAALDAVAQTAAADAESAAAKNAYLLAMAQRLQAKTAQDAAGANTAAAGVILGGWRLTGLAVHGIISGLAELLAVAIPGAVAAASGAFVLYQGVVEQVVPRLDALQGATEATSKMLHVTAGDALGLGHSFQSAQNAANPIPTSCSANT